MKQQGKKLTVANTRSAAAAPDNRPAPRMKSRAQIENEINRLLECRPQDADLWGRVNALQWVIGANGGDE